MKQPYLINAKKDEKGIAGHPELDSGPSMTGLFRMKESSKKATKNFTRVLLLSFCIASVCFNLQAQTVYYNYDNSGNQVLRTIILPVPSSEREADKEIPEPIVQKDPISKIEITIYPNPTKGMLKIDLAGGEIPANARIQLYNTGGKLILNLPSISESNTIDLSAQPSGIYVMRIILAEDNVSVWKIIKN
ncbi:MAG: T9SS type A sorting domain-containing protein [Candidatus Symbiothrix sp.]|jgi:hypothetical protein|nr:T9SS type A sorting domain-containing protein [Candidatus Symbiothrix sp.]